MSGNAPATGAAGTSARVEDPGTPWWRRRAQLLLVVAALLAVAAAAVWSSPGVVTGTPLDPDNPGPDGARALARVLEDRDVEVHVARGADALEAAAVGAGTTVLVTSSHELGPATGRDLLGLAGTAEVVVVDPSPVLAEELSLGRPTRTTLTDAVPAGCDDARFSGLELYADRAWALPGPGCFPSGDGVLLTAAEDGLTLLGAGDLLTNEQVVIADNAAVALRLLGGHDRLVWYVPDARDLVGQEAFSLRSVLPRWLLPGLWVMALAGVGLVLWRVRRLGPLAREPLPVSVKAVETTLGRGRLYRRSGDRAHAAARLRTATRRRLAEALGLGTAEPRAVAEAVARHLGAPVEETVRLLSPTAPAPASDQALVELATRLSTLEEEVRVR